MAETNERLKIGILASGSGTNFESIADAVVGDNIPASIDIVICNRPGAAVIAKAETRGLRTVVMDHRGYSSREEFDGAIAQALVDAEIELVVLAGFDRIVTGAFLRRFPDRVLNIHPALLPAFKGLDAQRQAADYGVRIAGCTVHLVDEEMDHGPIVAQAAVPAYPGEDPEQLRLRILAEEHRLYPTTIRWFAERRIEVKGRRVTLRGEGVPTASPLHAPDLES